MHKSLKVFTVVTLLAAASVPAMCHAMGEAAKEPAKTSGASVLEKAADTATAAATKQSPIPPGAPASFADIAHDLLPAVVNISSTQKAGAVSEDEAQGQDPSQEVPQFPPGSPFQDFFDEFLKRHGQGGGLGGPEQSMPATSLGSGFVIDAGKGYIVTNNHVVKDADEIRVTFQDDTTLEAKLVGTDEKMDLAVIKVETDKPLTDVKFGDSDKMRVGDWVLAIGNPFGLGGTVTAGIVSAQQRNIHAGPYDDFIQTDASINRGNSGGPMFDLQGEVIGINTAIFSPSGGSVGIGFAIPSNLAKSVVNQLIEYGKTRRGWIGVRIQSVTPEIAESLGLKTNDGALVADVEDKGPAAEAGLKTGDVILSFDGKPVKAMRNLPRIVAETKIDSKATITYWRDGKEHDASIKVGELEKAEEAGLTGEKQETIKETPAGTEIDKLGFTLGSITDTARTQYNIPGDVNGVLVTNVKPKGEALDKGLEAGDVIIEVSQQKVSTPKEAADAIAKVEKSGKSSVLLLVNRAGDVRFVALKIPGKDKKK